MLLDNALRGVSEVSEVRNCFCQLQLPSTNAPQWYISALKMNWKKLRGFLFFWKEGDLVFLIQCQRTRRWVWEWRWESDVRGQGQTEQRWKELSIEGSFLLDVILADENQEEGTSLHLPALLDKLQGVLNTHTHTQIHARQLSLLWFCLVFESHSVR